MLTIYHNPRCQKSRLAMQFLEENQLDYKVVKYLNEGLEKEELIDLLDKLQMSAIDLVRKNEKIWKENFKDHSLTDDEIIAAMFEFPKLMERPIVINQNKAVVARPADKINEIL